MTTINFKMPEPRPDFNNILRVLRRQSPTRPTLFEFFLNDALYDQLCQGRVFRDDDGLGSWRKRLYAYWIAGYDYLTIMASDFRFPTPAVPHLASKSQNVPGPITDRASFQAYHWLEPDDFDHSRLSVIADELPHGMRLIVWGPGGVLENVTSLLGFEQLCYMQAEDPDLLQEICDNVGSRLVRYYERAVVHPAVGAIISNDDWGFQSQTMLSPAAMRQYIFPWHKKIAATAHAVGKPVILHSCGNLREVWEDIIEDMAYDGKHSFEDKIQPVESVYEQYGSRIAIMGGFDLDFICRSTPVQIRARVQAMLSQVGDRGGFAVGTGNSVPYYVPTENYLAMIDIHHS
ncbi:MAG: uroporphyrinogen decarboxylase family protein [Bacillota bacterium]|nr:uroporphyrinogen decarboxylase family protein [Bacillota bacterium]